MREDGQILHSHRFLVLDKDGTLIERYDDNRWPVDRVLQQLASGQPLAPSGTSGTLTPAE
jgi:cytochrome oxidase Cu insertion factor (SCO1/SenC/PrrC family)